MSTFRCNGLYMVKKLFISVCLMFFAPKHISLFTKCLFFVILSRFDFLCSSIL